MALAWSAALIAGTLAFGGVEGNGRQLEEVRRVSSFKAVEVGDSLQAEIRRGEESRVTVVAEENLLPLIRSDVTNGVLRAKLPEGVHPTRAIRLIVTTPSLEGITVRDQAQVRAWPGQTPTLRLRASDAAALIVHDIDAENLSVELRDDAEATLNGHAKRGKVDLNGGDVSLTSKGLDIDQASLNADGALGFLSFSLNLDSDDAGVRVKVNGETILDEHDSEESERSSKPQEVVPVEPVNGSP